MRRSLWASTVSYLQQVAAVARKAIFAADRASISANASCACLACDRNRIRLLKFGRKCCFAKRVAPIAQPVEHLICNQGVGSSSLSGGTKFTSFARLRVVRMASRDQAWPAAGAALERCRWMRSSFRRKECAPRRQRYRNRGHCSIQQGYAGGRVPQSMCRSRYGIARPLQFQPNGGIDAGRLRCSGCNLSHRRMPRNPFLISNSIA